MVDFEELRKELRKQKMLKKDNLEQEKLKNAKSEHIVASVESVATATNATEATNTPLSASFKKVNLEGEKLATNATEITHTPVTLKNVNEKIEKLCEEVKDERSRNKVVICIEKLGEERKLSKFGRFVLIKPKLKTYFIYNNNVYDSVADIPTYHPPKKMIRARLKEMVKSTKQKIPITEYHDPTVDAIMQQIAKDPISWVLKKTSYIVGNEKEKILALLAVVSTRLTIVPRPGIYRLHLVLEGKPGAGKSATLEAVYRLFKNVIILNRLTTNGIGYLNIKNINGLLVFVRQLDDPATLNYVKDAMSETSLITYYPQKDELTGKIVTKPHTIQGQACWSFTTPSPRYGVEIADRVFRIYLHGSSDDNNIADSILNDAYNPLTDEEQIALMKWLFSLKEKPIPDEIKKRIKQMFAGLQGYSKRAYAKAKVITKAWLMMGYADFNQLMKIAGKDLVYSAVGLSEQDLEILKTVTHDNTTQELAEKLNISPTTLRKRLHELSEQGLILENYEGKQYFWSISELGSKIVKMLEILTEDNSDNEEEVVKTTNGYLEDPQFWRKHIFEHFGFNPFSATEFASSIQDLKPSEAEKVLQQLFESGVVGIVFSNSNTKLYALQGGAING